VLHLLKHQALNDNVSPVSTNLEASFGVKIIFNNPLIYVTNTNPAEIVKIDISNPLIPVHQVFVLTGAKFAKDVVHNSITGFFYIACADGIVVKVDETDFNNQTLIDLSDTDDMEVIESLDTEDITFISTSNETGELYAIDGRTEVLGDLRLDVLVNVTQFGDFQFDTIQAKKMDSDLQVLSLITSGIADMDFKCL